MGLQRSLPGKFLKPRFAGAGSLSQKRGLASPNTKQHRSALSKRPSSLTRRYKPIASGRLTTLRRLVSKGSASCVLLDTDGFFDHAKIRKMDASGGRIITKTLWELVLWNNIGLCKRVVSHLAQVHGCHFAAKYMRRVARVGQRWLSRRETQSSPAGNSTSCPRLTSTLSGDERRLKNREEGFCNTSFTAAASARQSRRLRLRCKTSVCCSGQPSDAGAALDSASFGDIKYSGRDSGERKGYDIRFCQSTTHVCMVFYAYRIAWLDASQCLAFRAAICVHVSG